MFFLYLEFDLIWYDVIMYIYIYIIYKNTNIIYNINKHKNFYEINDTYIYIYM